MDRSSTIFVAGHRGLAGSALVRRLRRDGYTHLITRTRAELDLTDQGSVNAFFRDERPEYVFLAAARVGGIHANDAYPAEFIYTNLAIQTATIHAAYETGVRRLVFFGSNCAYPRECPQPMREEYLHTGHLEPTNEPFAVAKLAGMAMCNAYNRQYGTSFIAVIPAGLYGPDDNFAGDDSHVVPALMRRFHQGAGGNGSPVTVWGSGAPVREFLYVDDLADACMFLMNLDDAALRDVLETDKSVINIPSPEGGVTIKDLAAAIRDRVAPNVDLEFDTSRPDGFPRKVVDGTRFRALGWSPSVGLEEGIEKTYDWYKRALTEGLIRGK